MGQRLAIAEDPSTVQSFLTMFASLFREDAVGTVSQLVDLNGTPPMIELIMDKWVERHMELRTQYDILLSTIALGSILLCSHPALDSITVKGQRLDTSSEIRTRSKSVTSHEEWSKINLRVKICLLLIDSYIEAVAQGELPEDEDEWIDDEDDSSDEENQLQGHFSMYGELLGDLLDQEIADVDALELKRRENDPLSSVSLRDYIPQILRQFSEANMDRYLEFCSLCSPIQSQYLTSLQ